MKKNLLYLLAVLILLVQVAPDTSAKTTSASNPVKIAVRKYKIGNYTGCLQDCQAIVRRDPSNSLAYYYMAMSYAQAGMKDAAVNSYARVLALNPNPRLLEYATTGKRCLETPDQCHPAAPEQVKDESALDKFIASPTVDGLSTTVRQNVQQRSLDAIKNEINSDKEIDSYDLKKLNQNKQSEFKTENVAQNTLQESPSNDEIVAALKVLKKAGLTAYPQPLEQATANNPYVQMASYQNPEQAQLNMLMGSDAQSQNGNNNAMMNMLPFMLAQNKNGTSNYSPQMMQSVIMNSMMSNMNFDTDKDKDR